MVFIVTGARQSLLLVPGPHRICEKWEKGKGKIPPQMPCDTFTLNLRLLGGCHIIAFGVLKSLRLGTGQPQQETAPFLFLLAQK